MKFFPFLLTALFIMATATSCKDGGTASTNPLLAQWDTPFGVPPFDKITTADYMPALREAMEMHNEELQAIVDDAAVPDFTNTILAFDESGAMLNRVVAVFYAVAAADTTPELQLVEEEVGPMISAHIDAMMLNEELFAKIKTVYDSRATASLDALQSRLLEKTYMRFVRSGANLSPEQKEEFKTINKDISIAAFKWGKNLLDENARYRMVLAEKDLAGLPSAVRNSARQAAKDAGLGAEEYVFDISAPSIFPFLGYSERADLRKELFDAYINKCNHDDSLDNKSLVNDLVRLRTRRANLLGYKTHADYVLDDVMAGTPANVYNLLDEVWGPALETAKRELSAMQAIKLRETGKSDFSSSDWWFYAEKERKAKYDLDQEALRPYFSLDNVRTGIFELSNILYGITFRPVVVPVYNEECSAYEVLDADGSHLGVLYMDFFPRPGRKSSGAWCGTFRDVTYRDGAKQSPLVYVVCNFTRPTGSTPALLNMDETETFFHEFGHALNMLFIDTPYSGLVQVERDFVELPSQIFENWATEPDMLRKYAIHYQTGKVIPDDLIRRIRESAKFNSGFTTTELIAASYSDMDIYTIENFTEIDVNAFEKEMLNTRRGLIPQIEPRYRYPYFAHIFDGEYSAGYYSYIWAEVLEKDAYEAFIEVGDIFDSKIAKRFRDEILSKGGAADGMTLYRNFRGKDPDRIPLMRARGFIE